MDGDRFVERSATSKDRLLQTVGGILLVVMGFISSYCFYQILAHSDRLTRVETRQDSNDSVVKEIKADIHEIGAKLDRVWQTLERRP